MIAIKGQQQTDKCTEKEDIESESESERERERERDREGEET